MIKTLIKTFKKSHFFMLFACLMGSMSMLQAADRRPVIPAVSHLEVSQQNVIMQVIKENFNTPALRPTLYTDILNFYNVNRAVWVDSLDQVSYQDLLRKFETYPNDYPQSAVNAVRAIEKAIMHLYDSRVYMAGSYKPVQSIFFTGIRKSWLKPWTYFSWDNWTGDNDDTLQQLITELDRLANCIERHSYSEFIRLKTTVESYRNWRRNTLIFLAAYLAADLIHHGAKNSTIKHLLHKDACGVAGNAMLNIEGTTIGTIKLLPKVAWYTTKTAAQLITWPFR